MMDDTQLDEFLRCFFFKDYSHSISQNVLVTLFTRVNGNVIQATTR